MAIDKQCPILDWRNYSDLILSKEDLQFAANQSLSVEQLQLIFCTFERIVNFKSYLLSYNDMKTKILFEYPDFEKDLSTITSRLSQTNDDRDCVIELAFVYWQGKRKHEPSTPLKRCFWKRYPMEDNDPDGIF